MIKFKISEWYKFVKRCINQYSLVPEIIRSVKSCDTYQWDSLLENLITDDRLFKNELFKKK